MVEDTDLFQVLPSKQALIRDILIAFLILGAAVLAIVVTLVMQLNANRAAPIVAAATALPAAPTAALCTSGSCAVSPVPIYADLPIKGRTLGSADAPVKVVLYSDFQCPPCKQVDLTLLEPLIQQYIRAGTVQFTYQPVALFGVESERAAFVTLRSTNSSSRLRQGFSPSLVRNSVKRDSRLPARCQTMAMMELPPSDAVAAISSSSN